MSLKQIVKYIVKTDPEQINLDIGAYKTLRKIRRVRRMAMDNAYANLAQFVDTASTLSNSCVAVHYSMSPSFEPKWVDCACERFNAESKCTNTECKCFKANQNYFNAVEHYKASRDACRQFWATKFARVKK